MDKAWKAWERRVAALFGGKRRGPGTGFGFSGEGKSDVEHEVFAIECKLYSRPTYGVMLEGVHQSERNSEGKVPLLIMRRKRDRWQDAMVCMRLETFLESGDV
jgi:hypothetical protein